MTIMSTADLLPLANGLSFNVSVSVPDFREVIFLMVRQDNYWMLSIDGGPGFRLATFTKYNLYNFISEDIDYIFQLKPKNNLNQVLSLDNIGEFYFKFFSGDGFDDVPAQEVIPDYVYEPA